MAGFGRFPLAQGRRKRFRSSWAHIGHAGGNTYFYLLVYTLQGTLLQLPLAEDHFPGTDLLDPPVAEGYAARALEPLLVNLYC